MRERVLNSKQTPRFAPIRQETCGDFISGLLCIKRYLQFLNIREIKRLIEIVLVLRQRHTNIIMFPNATAFFSPL